jgi:hypothetical protein
VADCLLMALETFEASLSMERYILRLTYNDCNIPRRYWEKFAPMVQLCCGTATDLGNGRHWLA